MGDPKKIKDLKRQGSAKGEEASLELREVKKDTGNDIEVKGDRVSLKALAVISSWNQYSNQSTLSKVYHKIVNSIRRT